MSEIGVLQRVYGNPVRTLVGTEDGPSNWPVRIDLFARPQRNPADLAGPLIWLGESHPIRRTVYASSLAELIAAATAELTADGDELELHVFVVEDRFPPPEYVLEIQVIGASVFGAAGRYLSNFELPLARLIAVRHPIQPSEADICGSLARCEDIHEHPPMSPSVIVSQRIRACALTVGHEGRHSTETHSRTTPTEFEAWQWD